MIDRQYLSVSKDAQLGRLLVCHVSLFHLKL